MVGYLSPLEANRKRPILPLDADELTYLLVEASTDLLHDASYNTFYIDHPILYEDTSDMCYPMLAGQRLSAHVPGCMLAENG